VSLLISDYTLNDNARIAVIGGGPSGSLFSIFALKMAKLADKKIGITIFEPKDFTRDGPIGCNRCGGVISELLVQTLAVEGINLPPKVVQRGINSYVLHTARGDVHIESPAFEKRIATVYRGGGPKGMKEQDRESFDNFLLQYAVREGASHVPLKIDGIQWREKPVLYAQSKDLIEADLIVGAFGINSSTWKLFEELQHGYKKPESTSAFITEIELGNEKVSQLFGSSIHFFLLPEPKNIKFAALIPKGRYVTLCLLGKNINQQTVTNLLDSPICKKLLPSDMMKEKFCKCFPNLSLTSAKGAFTDRMVVIGDAGSTRLFKDGLGAAYTMGKAAAKTAIFHGVSKKDFHDHYLPVYRNTSIDNKYGSILYRITDMYKNYGLLTESMIEVVQNEQRGSEDLRRLSSILWDTFTGNEMYKNIFHRSLNVKLHFNLSRAFTKAILRRVS
jgi:flavin-dependent dehydrogenase